jgi:hypothetical protein
MANVIEPRKIRQTIYIAHALKKHANLLSKPLKAGSKFNLKDNATLCLKGSGQKDVHWIVLVRNSGQWRVLMNTARSLLVPKW